MHHKFLLVQSSCGYCSTHWKRERSQNRRRNVPVYSFATRVHNPHSRRTLV